MANLPHNDLPGDLFVDSTADSIQKNWFDNLLGRWHTLTALPEARIGSTFIEREAVRRSRLSSSVIFFFLILLVSLLPVTFLVISIYPTYFWLSLALLIICLGALPLNRRGHTNATGLIVTIGSFAILTTALFSTVPFDETTLQGYDMYIILLLLSVALLPIQAIFVYFTLCVGVIIGSLYVMPLTPTLQTDLHERAVLILARPIGVLFMGGGIAYIFATTLTSAIRRANRAETIAKLEHEQRQLRDELAEGTGQILETLVEVSNGNLNARAPLAQDNVLWQIARSLNTLLVRFQRAVQAERQLQTVDEVVSKLVMYVQNAKRTKQKDAALDLPLTRNPHLDPLITELQGKTISMSPLPTSIPAAFDDNRPRQWPRNG